MKFDIPINIEVTSTNEQKAEQQVFEFLMASMKEFGIEFGIANFEYFEFLAKEPCNTGCGNHDKEQGQRVHTQQSTCNCSKQSCC